MCSVACHEVLQCLRQIHKFIMEQQHPGALQREKSFTQPTTSRSLSLQPEDHFRVWNAFLRYQLLACVLDTIIWFSFSKHINATGDSR